MERMTKQSRKGHRRLTFWDPRWSAAAQMWRILALVVSVSCFLHHSIVILATASRFDSNQFLFAYVQLTMLVLTFPSQYLLYCTAGFYRNGYCSTGPQDFGRHTVCVKVTDKFLEFSKNVGNDLSTPVPEYMFPGLSEGDVWCLCAQRWHQVWEAAPELAPKLYLKATHEKTLDYVPYDVLRMYAIDGEEADKEREGLDEQRARLEALLGKEAEKAEKPQEEE